MEEGAELDTDAPSSLASGLGAGRGRGWGGSQGGVRRYAQRRGLLNSFIERAFLAESTAEAKVQEHALGNIKMNMAGLGLHRRDEGGKVDGDLKCQAEGLGFLPRALGSHSRCVSRTLVTGEVVLLAISKSGSEACPEVHYTSPSPCQICMPTSLGLPAPYLRKPLGSPYGPLPTVPETQPEYASRAAPLSDASLAAGRGRQEGLG